MNKALLDKVKDLCKDYGLSEKYLEEITETMGGSISDDSTDTEEIETVANLIASVAKSSQGEATRWAAKKDSKKKGKKKPKEDDDEDGDDEDGDDEDGDDPSKKSKKKSKSNDDRLKVLEEELEKYKTEAAKSARQAAIESAMEKHKIPAYLRKRFAKSIADDEDIEEAVSGYKQELITNGLDTDSNPDGAKGASEKDVDEASNNLLEQISVKSKS